MSIEVVLFDVYETLADYPPDRVRPVEIQHLLARYGVEISYQAYIAARNSVFSLDAPRREITCYTDFLALVFHRMKVSVSLDLLTSLTAMFEKRDGMVLYPDALDALRAVKEGGRTCCTFTTLPRFMLGDEASHILDHVDLYFDNSRVGFPKGHPKFYAGIAAELGVAPDRILCTGNDPIGDVQLPIEAGWNGVWLDRSGAAPDLVVGQRGVIATLADLKPHYID